MKTYRWSRGGEWHINCRGHARPAAGGARPRASAPRGGAASPICATCGHPGHQEIQCGGCSFNHISSRLSRMGVCAARQRRTTSGLQLPGTLPCARERTEIFQGAAVGAGGLHLKGLHLKRPFEATLASQGFRACNQAAKGPPSPRGDWCHV